MASATRSAAPRVPGGLARSLGSPLPLQLLRAREAVMQLFRPHLRALGLTDQQGRILRVLAERKWVEMRELSAETCIHPASLSRMVPRMHARGIVKRWKDHADARRVMVSITKRGLQLLRGVHRHTVDIYATVGQRIGSAEMTELYRCLDLLIRRLNDKEEAVAKAAPHRHAARQATGDARRRETRGRTGIGARLVRPRARLAHARKSTKKIT